MTIKKATLVLEGGATRGIFTSGALDYLMERDLYFSDVIGVSAGSCNAVDYVSRQPGRTRDCMIPTDKEGKYYYGIRDFVKEKSLMNMDLIFDKYPKELLPFDFETYFNSEINCQIVTTNCLTGKAEYMTEDSDNDRLMKLCRASSSMPLLTPIVNIDNVPYLDGGLADSVPIRRAQQMENEKIVVILTKNQGYRKSWACIFSSFSCIVSFDAALDIGRVASIEGSIRTLDNIHIGFSFHNKSHEFPAYSSHPPHG